MSVFNRQHEPTAPVTVAGIRQTNLTNNQFIFSSTQESMVDFISGRHPASSFLDVFTSGLFGETSSALTVAGH